MRAALTIFHFVIKQKCIWRMNSFVIWTYNIFYVTKRRKKIRNVISRHFTRTRLNFRQESFHCCTFHFGFLTKIKIVFIKKLVKITFCETSINKLFKNKWFQITISILLFSNFHKYTFYLLHVIFCQPF